ncbi:MAG: peptide chain release factor N(5)-glutamine methyltransferase [Clostridiales bacterium]|nr:peptide chain release factor N(5)-glutamine methyltransferase [Clostridiales bacterium]
MTYREAQAEAKKRFEEAGIEEADVESRILLMHVCGFDITRLLCVKNDEMRPERIDKYFLLVSLREKRIPLQHIMGYTFFMDIPLKVDERALIPRQDTEELCEQTLNLLHDLTEERDPSVMDRAGGDKVKVLDLCTGSGCLAVALKVLCPDCSVQASDISEDALALARENAHTHKADITFVHSDLFENIHRRFDVIVSNPPYIPAATVDTLAPEVREHEPRLALDGGEDGLAYYRKILKQCGYYLNPGGYILMEIGSDQAEAVSALMTENGFSDIRVIHDLAGLDRVIRGRRE